MQSLGLSGGVLRSAAEFNTGLVESALYELKLLAPLKKPLFIKACVEVVMADGQLSVAEGELMRALCAALDSPLPPLIEGR
jgi:tellurite resistance protein